MRRQLFGLGLTGAVTALLAPVGQTEAASEPTEATGLRYRIKPGYRPELSTKAQRRLTRATLDFLLDTHPPGTTLSIWDEDPRNLPHLEKHIATLVDAVFTGVKTHLPEQPVDPVLVMAILYNESRFAPLAISPTGALGMAQFMPDTAGEYGLLPIARPKLWQRFRDKQSAERTRRSADRNAFLTRYGLESFSATAVIEYTLKIGTLDALTEYHALADTEKPELDALRGYVTAVRQDLEPFDFFTDGAAAVGRIDARTQYAAATAAVDYIARRLAENSGMTSSAIAAYNAGPAAVRDGNPRSVLYGYGELPAFPETVLYLQRVLVVYSKLRDRLTSASA